MFDAKVFAPSFFEFIEPVYLAGYGYVGKIACSVIHANPPQVPALKRYIASPDAYLFIMENGAATCVHHANIRSIAGQLIAPSGQLTGTAEGNREEYHGRVASDQRPDGWANRDEQVEKPAHVDSPSPETNPSELPMGNATQSYSPEPPQSPEPPVPRRRGRPPKYRGPT